MSAKEEPRKQEQQKPNATDRAPDISNRPIALPKLRLNKLRPANRQMPTSKEIAMNDALFTVNGKPQARRPDYFVFEDEPLGIEDPGIDISTSYIDDTGFDLVDAELGSDFGKSFDLDMLPDAPARRLSDYNIGVVDVVPRTMSPEDVKSTTAAIVSR
ncbi:hypothetical protein H4217_000033 [Coemansia sp. RSA 1939]|nr:hypothetical protein H4217_000033 [Coemansia sp. RSA 1939]